MNRLLSMVLFLAYCYVPLQADDVKQPAQQVKMSEKSGLPYLLYLPPGYEKDEKKVFPLILFLHGSGESGTKIDLVKKHGPPKIVETKRDFGFIVVSPQAPTRGWQPTKLLALLDDVEKTYKVDRDRIYVTGLSMGGFGTWRLAAVAPERFAAVAPICGGGDPKSAEKLKGLPIWVFHGAKDKGVPIKMSEDMVKALKEVGSEVKFTVYSNAEHDSWTESYNNPELYKWFLSHTRRPSK